MDTSELENHFFISGIKCLLCALETKTSHGYFSLGPFIKVTSHYFIDFRKKGSRLIQVCKDRHDLKIPDFLNNVTAFMNGLWYELCGKYSDCGLDYRRFLWFILLPAIEYFLNFI